MTLPALLLGFALSTLFGAAFHFWRGGGAGRLLLDLILGWAGFWAGHGLGALLGLALFKVGPLYLGPASIVAVLVLLLGHWLSLPART